MAIDRRQLLGALTVTGAAALVSCSSSGAGSGHRTSPTTDPTRSPPSGGPTGRPRISPRVAETLATGLTVPWGIAFLAGGGALVSERDTARIVRIRPGRPVREVATVPGVVPGGDNGGEGGLLGLALSRDQTRLFAYTSTAEDNRVVVMRYDGSSLTSPEAVLTGIPTSLHHNGGRLAFGTDGYLYVSTGDAEDTGNSQDKGSLGGKILRLGLDGSPATGNPFGNAVWSYGHRNVEGISFDGAGRLWASEFGNQALDELNLIEKGHNYGWPEAEGPSDDPDLTDPEVTWPVDDCSPSGIAIARSHAFLGALQGQCVFAVPLDRGSAGRPEALFSGEHGRIRTVAAAPDGSLWVTTSNTDGRATPGPQDDQILRVTL